jgi:hypothetical protein
MRRGILVIAILLVLGVGAYFFNAVHQPRPLSSRSVVSDSASSAGQPASSNQGAALSSPLASNPSSSESAVAASANPAAMAGQLDLGTNAVADLPPATVLANVRHAVRQFGQMFGGDPVGTNPEITSQLLGDNPRHINFIDPSAGMQVNDKGDLVDAWGTPYFFHQISGSDMEIHSAGPDRIMWTSDDIVVK